MNISLCCQTSLSWDFLLMLPCSKSIGELGRIFLFLKVDDKSSFIACTTLEFLVFRMYLEHSSQFLWNYFEQLISAPNKHTAA